MQEIFNSFLSQYLGHGAIGDTAENTGQCVGLVEVWTDSLLLPHTWGDADQLFNDADTNFFQKIVNTPDNIPQVGDIVVFSGDFNKGVGHCGISNGVGDANAFQLFEQNDPLGSACHLATYNYQFVIGWLRPLSSKDTLPVNKATFEKLVTKSTAYDTFVSAGYTTIDDVKKALGQKDAEIADLKSQLQTVQSVKAETGTPTQTVTGSTQDTNIPTNQPNPTPVDPLPTELTKTNFPTFVKWLQWLEKELQNM